MYHFEGSGSIPSSNFLSSFSPLAWTLSEMA